MKKSRIVRTPQNACRLPLCAAALGARPAGRSETRPQQCIRTAERKKAQDDKHHANHPRRNFLVWVEKVNESAEHKQNANGGEQDACDVLQCSHGVESPIRGRRPTTQAESCRSSDVNRESGTEGVNRR